VIDMPGMTSRKLQSCSLTARDWVDDMEKAMTTFKLFGALAILSALTAAPALAQHMIEEPGMYAFYHPNGDPNAGTAPAPVNSMAMDLSRGSGVMVMKMRSHMRRARR
jgi:hypothetical protein